MLLGAGIDLPAACPFDLERQGLGAALTSAGFESGRDALFVAEALFGYLSDAAVDRVLAFVASVHGRIVFTFGDGSIDARERTRLAGFRTCEEIGFDEVWRRYLPGKPHAKACEARVATAVG